MSDLEKKRIEALKSTEEAEACLHRAEAKLFPRRESQEIVRRNIEVLISLLKCNLPTRNDVNRDDGKKAIDELTTKLFKKLNEHLDQLKAS